MLSRSFISIEADILHHKEGSEIYIKKVIHYIPICFVY